MLRPVFLSGWAGFATLYPRLARACEFLVPFSDDPGGDENAVFTRLDQGGDTLLAWSTGGHMALKHGRCLGNFSRVILVAPFLHFTDSLPERIVRSMISELDRNPVGLLRAFYANCGWGGPGGPDSQKTPSLPRHIDTEKLAAGLEYLLTSVAAPDLPVIQASLTLVLPQDDRVIRPKAARKVAQLLDGAVVKQIPGGHCLSEEILHAFLHEATGAPLF